MTRIALLSAIVAALLLAPSTARAQGRCSGMAMDVAGAYVNVRQGQEGLKASLYWLDRANDSNRNERIRQVAVDGVYLARSAEQLWGVYRAGKSAGCVNDSLIGVLWEVRRDLEKAKKAIEEAQRRAGATPGGRRG